MPKLTKVEILRVQREKFADASDAFEITPTLATWRTLEQESLAWIRANTMNEPELVELLESAINQEYWTVRLQSNAAIRHSVPVEDVCI